MTPELLEAVLAHAQAEAPREACGLFVQASHNTATYRPCRNVAEGDGQFQIAPEDWAAAEDAGEILGVVHSHPDGTCDPSPADQVGCDRSGLPWWIFNTEGEWKRVTPKDWDLVGHPFIWGLQECYTLASDFYGGLPDFIRRDGFWRADDLFTLHLAEAGFEVVTDGPFPGDAILFSCHGQFPDHCAIYRGDGRILHQPVTRTGVEENMGRLVEKIACVVRRCT
jgi:proteasome lid subunit RPN8/RPN11